MAAKADVVGYTHWVALDWATRNVTVNAIAPAPVMPEGLKGVMPDAVYESLVSQVPTVVLENPEKSLRRSCFWRKKPLLSAVPDSDLVFIDS